MSQYCAPAVPSSPGAYAAAFANLQHTYTEWGAADGAIPITLPDGRVVWLFGDTYVGSVNGDGSFSPPDHLINNSFIVQTGHCFAPLMGGGPRARSSLIPSPGAGQVYWPASGYVENGVLRVVLWRMQISGGGFSAISLEIATFSLPGLVQQGAPVRIPAASQSRPFGATSFADGGFVYFYGANSKLDVAPRVENIFVARATLGSTTAFSSWQFWNGATWTNDPNASTSMSFAPQPLPGAPIGLNVPVSQLWVTRSPSSANYLGTAKFIDAFTADISLFSAPAPAGPWTYVGEVANSGPWGPSYGAMTRIGLPGGTGPTVIFSNNHGANINAYGPRFLNPAFGLP